MEDANIVTSDNNEFKKCWLCHKGASFTLDGVTSFVDTDSLYEDNAAVYGGAIYATTTDVDISRPAGLAADKI